MPDATPSALEEPLAIMSVRHEAPAPYRTRSERLAAVEAALGALRTSMLAVRCAGSLRLRRHGISMSHLHLLTMLQHHGPMPMSRLAELLDVSLSTITGLVDRVEARGLIRRVRVPDDRRVVLVEVTTEGRTALDEADLLRTDLIAAALGRLGDDALDRLATAVHELHDAVHAELDLDPERFGDRDAPAHSRARTRDPAMP